MTHLRLYVLMIFLCIHPGLQSQHESAIDSSFGVDGFLEVGNDKFAVNNQEEIVIFRQLKHGVEFTKYNEDGQLVNTWGNNGIKKFMLDTTFYVDKLKSVSGNGFLLEGRYNTSYGFTIRLNAEVMLDSSFGKNGLVIIDTTISGHVTAQNGMSYALLPWDSIAGFRMIKYTEQGLRDMSFGLDGKMELKLRSDCGLHTIVLSDSLFCVRHCSDLGPMSGGIVDHVTVFDQKGRTDGVTFFPFSFGGAFFNESLPLLGYDLWYEDGVYAKLQYVDENGVIIDFDPDSEASKTTWNRRISLADIFSAQVALNKIYLFGGFFISNPENFTFFLKRMNLDGTLDLSFGQKGNIFFKKPDLQSAYYYPGGSAYYAEKFALVSGVIDPAGSGTRKNFIIKLKTGQITNNSDVKEDLSFTITPNPARTSVLVEGLLSSDHCEIFSLTGQTVCHTRIRNELTLCSPLSGIHFLRVLRKGESHVRSFSITQ